MLSEHDVARILREKALDEAINALAKIDVKEHPDDAEDLQSLELTPDKRLS